ncbi:MAG: hypothetical protein SPK50_01910, partial [Mobiluncus porci]|uniref:hypothetical protein n=1 Tax=Mobiluncus porci TaxID=2652278 RepID=UPI0023F1890A
ASVRPEPGSNSPTKTSPQNRGTNSVRKNLTKPNFHKTENQTKTLTNPTPQKSKARQKQKNA